MAQLRFRLVMQAINPVEPVKYVSPMVDACKITCPTKHVSFRDDISVVPTYAAFDEDDADPNFLLENCIGCLASTSQEMLSVGYDRRGEDKVREWTAPDMLQFVWNEIHALRRELFPNGDYFGDLRIRKSSLLFA